MKTILTSITALFVLCHPSFVIAQGSLTPPGVPAPTMKTLQQIEPRVSIDATNTPGDATHLFVISAPGSYYLTGNLSGVSGKSGIWVNSNNVTVDLSGFALLGVGGSLAGITDGGNNSGNSAIRHGSIISWGGAGLDISHSFDSVLADLIVTNNGGVGMSMADACVARDCVSRDNTGHNIVTAFNANLRNCIAVGSANGNGIILGQNSALTGCTANFNKLAGITPSPNCSLSNSTAGQNLGTGILTLDNSLITGCTAALNAQGGINCGVGCTVVNSSASQNSGSSASIIGGLGCTFTGCSASKNSTQFGILANPGSTLIQCTASNNTSALDPSAGILAAACTVKDCTAVSNATTNGTPSGSTGMGIYSNGTATLIQNCTSLGNRGDAVRVLNSSVVRENLVSNSVSGAGVHATGTDNRIEGNQVTNNNIGILVDATLNLVFGNTARGNTPNYSIVAGNRVATIVTPAVNTAISGNTGGTAFSTDASANFAY